MSLSLKDSKSIIKTSFIARKHIHGRHQLPETSCILWKGSDSSFQTRPALRIRFEPLNHGCYHQLVTATFHVKRVCSLRDQDSLSFHVKTTKASQEDETSPTWHTETRQHAHLDLPIEVPVARLGMQGQGTRGVNADVRISRMEHLP